LIEGKDDEMALSKCPESNSDVSDEARRDRVPWISCGLLLASADFVLLMATAVVASETGPRYLSLPFVGYAPALVLLTGTIALALIAWGLIDRFRLYRGQTVVRSPRVLRASLVLAGLGGLALVWLVVSGDKCVRLRKQQTEALRAGDCERAIALSTSLIELGDDYGFLLRSRAHCANGDLESAIVDVGERLRQLDAYPMLCPDSYLWRAVLYLKKHDDEKALSDMSRAIECDAKWYARAYYARAAVYRRLGRSLEAEKDFATAKRIDPSWSRPYDEPDAEYVFESRGRKTNP